MMYRIRTSQIFALALIPSPTSHFYNLNEQLGHHMLELLNYNIPNVFSVPLLSEIGSSQTFLILVRVNDC